MALIDTPPTLPLTPTSVKLLLAEAAVLADNVSITDVIDIEQWLRDRDAMYTELAKDASVPHEVRSEALRLRRAVRLAVVGLTVVLNALSPEQNVTIANRTVDELFATPRASNPTDN